MIRVREKKVLVKNSHHDSESDTDSCYGKKKTEHARNEKGDRKKIPVKNSRHDSESDTDSGYGKKKMEHAKSECGERKKVVVKSSQIMILSLIQIVAMTMARGK
jgi:serine/arginine repetitive matrix protein 2